MLTLPNRTLIPRYEHGRLQYDRLTEKYDEYVTMKSTQAKRSSSKNLQKTSLKFETALQLKSPAITV